MGYDLKDWMAALPPLLARIKGSWSTDATDNEAHRKLELEREGLLRLVKQLAGENTPELLSYLAGELELAIKIAGIEKRRGDAQFERAEALDAKIKSVCLADSKPGEPLEVTQSRLIFAHLNIVGKWVEFVKTKTNYTIHSPNWPTRADITHSSLLQRMMKGEHPLAEAEYKEKFKK